MNVLRGERTVKRILIMITVTLLAALIVFPAGGEENPGTEHIAFLYFPTNTSNLVEAARYIVRTMSAGKANASVRIGAVNSANLYDLAKLNDAVKGGSAWKGNITENVQDKVLNEISKNVTELWLLIPEDDAAMVFGQEALTVWLREVLNKENASVTVHAVLIGDTTFLPGEETLFGALMAEFPGRMTCVQAASNFTDNETRDASGKIHTGDYLIASRFGTPMDLKVNQDENGRGVINLPENTKVLLIAKAADESGVISLKDGQGNPYQLQKILEVRSEKRNGTNFTCWESEEIIQKGACYLEGADISSVKAYWYPDLTKLRIQANLPTPFKHGNNTVTFTLTEDYDRPEDFAVWYRYGFDSEEPVTASTVTYQEGAGWPVNISASTEKTRIQITPCVRLRMADGNLIYEDDGEKQEREIENIPVVMRDDAPKEVLLYLDTEKNQHGSIKFSWEDFLEYNKEDEDHSFEVHLDGGREEIELKTDANGFELTAAAETAADQPVLLHLSCDGEEKCTLEIHSEEIVTLINRLVQISSPQNGNTLKPNEQMTVEVRAEESLEEKLEAAKRQGISTTPQTTDLRVNVSGAGENRTLSVTGSENQTTVFTLGNELEAEKKYPWKLTTGDGGRVWNEGEISLHLQNHRPAAVQTFEESVRIPLEGLIGRYEKVDLLDKALGTNSLMDLFQDDETEVSSVKLTIEGIEGLEQENGPAPTADEGRWTFTLKNGAPLQIMTGNPGDYQLTLTASDGVNESEPVVLRVQVYSTFIQILIYVGIGLAALLVLLIVILIIRQIRKPTFDNIRIRCLAVSDEDQEHSRELLNNANPIPMVNFGKKAVSLQAALILTGQPPLSAEESAAVRDIQLLPTRHDELNLQFGKAAMQAAGRQEKKEIVTQGNLCRIRMGKTNILVENVR